MLLAAALKFYLHLARARQLMSCRCNIEHRLPSHSDWRERGRAPLSVISLLIPC